MDLAQLIGDLRQRGTDLPSIEVKAAAGGFPESVIETMCAFANVPGGGLIILGLDEKSGFAPVRLASASVLAAGLASRARTSFEPPLHVDVDVDRFEDSDIVVARVREIPAVAKPCIVKRTGKAYLRFSDGDYSLSQLEIDGFVANRVRPQFDEAAVAGATLADFDRARLDDFIATGRRSDGRLAAIVDDTDLLKRTGVVSIAGVPTVAGLLALGEYPQQFLPHCNIRAALLPEAAAPGIRALDAATFTGPIAAILDDVVEWVARNSRRRLVERVDGHVTEILDPPAVAVRELVANALVHRDLAEWASSRAIELRMSPSAFHLSNPGGLYGITVDRLGTHPLTSARNRRLVEICKHVRTSDGNVVEAMASGIPATIAALRGAGMAEPQFFDQALMFTVSLDRSAESRAQPTIELDRRVPMTPGEQQLLDVLVEPSSVANIAERLGISRNAVHKHLAKLREKGLVIVNGGSGARSTYERASTHRR
jgi:ATP-dependent DNA helicase RecG